MGVARAPIAGSGVAPAWIASVANPGWRSVMAVSCKAGSGLVDHNPCRSTAPGLLGARCLACDLAAPPLRAGLAPGCGRRLGLVLDIRVGAALGGDELLGQSDEAPADGAVLERREGLEHVERVGGRKQARHVGDVVDRRGAALGQTFV